MSLNRFHVTVMAAWMAMLSVLLAVAAAMGADVRASHVLMMLVVAVAPPLVLLVVFRGASRAIGQVLYETDRASSASMNRKMSDVR